MVTLITYAIKGAQNAYQRVLTNRLPINGIIVITAGMKSFQSLESYSRIARQIIPKPRNITSGMENWIHFLFLKQWPKASIRKGLIPLPERPSSKKKYGKLEKRFFSKRPSIEQRETDPRNELQNNTPQIEISDISGYRTFSELEATAFSDMREKLKQVFERFGFSPIENRPVERAGNLASKGGLNKEIYRLCRLENSEPVDVGLPFDRTVPFALWIAQYSKEIAFPFKRWDINYSFRGEHAVANLGRYRGFVQADIDTVGPKMEGIQADAECFATAAHALKALHVPRFVMHINHIKIAKGIIQSAGIKEDDVQAVLHLLDKLDKLEKQEIVAQIQKLCAYVAPHVIEGLVNKFDYCGNLDDFKMEKEWGEQAFAAFEELKNLFDLMEKLGVQKNELIYNARMVRGLDYYTGVVCETFIEGGLSKHGSIASGGRYDGLVDTFTGKQTGLKGVGISIGLTRLFDILLNEKVLNPVKRGNADVVVAFRTQEQLSRAIEIATKMRESGLNVDLYSGDKKVGKQLDYANKKGTPYCFMVMDTAEDNPRNYAVKNMGRGSQEEFGDADDAIKYLIGKVKNTGKNTKRAFLPLDLKRL